MRPMSTAVYRGKGQGKGKGRAEGRLGQGGRGRSKGGERLMGTTAYGGKGSKGRAANGDRLVGAASCRRDHHSVASCRNPRGLERKAPAPVDTGPPPPKAPSGKRPRKWPSGGPPATVGERYLTAGLGWPLGRTWPTAKASAFLCMDSTHRSETGQVHGPRWHQPTKGMGSEGVW